MVHRRAGRLLAGEQFQLVVRMAAMGRKSTRLSPYECGAARRGGRARLDCLTAALGARRLLRGAVVCRASGERRSGGLDRAAQDTDGGRVWLAGDSGLLAVRTMCGTSQRKMQNAKRRTKTVLRFAF